MANEMQWPYAGLGHAPSYQVSGIPYVTSSTAPSSQAVITLSFPHVTQWVHVRNINTSGRHLRLGFSSNGVSGSNTNYIIVQDSAKANSEVTLNIKCSEIYLQADSAHTVEFSIAAGLTGIPTSELAGTGPSGNNWSGSSGIG